MAKSMNKSTGKFLKCILERPYFTEGKVYEVFKDLHGDWFVVDDNGYGWYSIVCSIEGLPNLVSINFEIIDNTSTDKQKGEIVVGSKVWVVDKGNVSVDTIVKVVQGYQYLYQTEKASYDIDGFSLTNDYTSARIFLINEANQKALRVVYPQLTFEIPKEKSLAEKRYDVIKKLYDRGDIVVVRCWDSSGEGVVSVSILKDLRGFDNTHPYVTSISWKYAYAVDRKGNEITEVLDE